MSARLPLASASSGKKIGRPFWPPDALCNRRSFAVFAAQDDVDTRLYGFDAGIGFGSTLLIRKLDTSVAFSVRFTCAAVRASRDP